MKQLNDENAPPSSSHGKFLSQKFGPGTPSSTTALAGGSKPPTSNLYHSGAATNSGVKQNPSHQQSTNSQRSDADLGALREKTAIFNNRQMSA